MKRWMILLGAVLCVLGIIWLSNMDNPTVPESSPVENVDLINSDLNDPAKETEDDLIKQFSAEYAKHFDKYVYLDMNHDQSNEIIGVFLNEDNYYETWYVSSDGKTIEKIHTNNDQMDDFEINIIEFEKERHVVVDAYRFMGTGKNFSIFSLEENIVVELSNQYGYVKQVEDTILLNVEAYDGMYDPDIDARIMHTWKNTYLHYDEKYKEYYASKIDHNAFSQFINSQEIMDAIEKDTFTDKTDHILVSYYKRSNGIFHIQIKEYENTGIINYGYYTFGLEDNQLIGDLDYNPGIMYGKFSFLEVTY